MSYESAFSIGLQIFPIFGHFQNFARLRGPVAPLFLEPTLDILARASSHTIRLPDETQFGGLT